MNTILVNPDIVLRITADPALYAEAPFLAPMRDPAMRIHKKLGSNCKGCAKAAIRRTAIHLANAFVRLVSDESKRQPNSLHALKAVMAKILNTQIGEVRLECWEPNNVKIEVKF